jgi:hypothetical protein
LILARYEPDLTTVLRRTKLEIMMKEAVDVVVFEDNLESNNPILKLLKTLLFALFFAEVFAQDKQQLIPNLKLHWLSPEILKAEKLISVQNIKEPWLIPDGLGTKLGLRYKKMDCIRNS